MSEKDLEAIITEILANSLPSDKIAHQVENSSRRPADRRLTAIARSRKRRTRRNPLYASLRLIILGLVILLVPLMFSAKKVHPPRSLITGAVTSVQNDAPPV